MFNYKPRYRSKLRLTLATWYFQARRFLAWLLQSRSFASTQSGEALPFTVFTHQTPLYRKLRNVDMWIQENKVHNLKIAIINLDGLTIKPGETMSFWRRVGRPSRSKGYKPGMVLNDQGGFDIATGGGLCQLTNLIYWMTLHTPLTVTERYLHMYDVFPDSNRTLPFGSGATCSYNYIDLQIRNDTTQPFQLQLSVTDTELVGSFRTTTTLPYSYRVYEVSPEIRHEVWGGYSRHNIIMRDTHDASHTRIRSEKICENHAIMSYQPYLEASQNR
ncbi:MAG: VanW family protein [Patescibacteria group bacterium]